MNRANNIFTITVLIVATCHGFLNIEELTDMKYALDILNKPLNALEVNPSEGLKLASRHGQDYYCKLPRLEGKATEAPEDKVPKNTPVSSLLEPMRQEACLKAVKGWWTYEFCYGKYIKQYHSEDDVQKGDITYLGYYESDFDWSQETLDETTHLKRHKLNRYHSQTYVNGTACDIINHKRDTEIRYICDNSSPETYIERVDEPSTCSYVITVHTPYICSHPHTRPVKTAKPLDIVCQPILAPNEFKTYQRKKLAELSKKAAKLESYLKEAQLLYKKVAEIPLKTATEEAVRRELEERAKEYVSPIGNLDQTVDSAAKFFTDLQGFLDFLVPKKSPEQQETKKEESQVPTKPHDLSKLEAIKMIERFIVPERLQNLEPFQQNLLIRNVVDLMKVRVDVPTADYARKLERYITSFVSISEEIQDHDKQVAEIQQKLGQSLNNELLDTAHEMLPPDLKEEKEDEYENSEGEEKKSEPLSVKLKIHKLKNMEDFGKLKAEDFLSDDVEDPVELDPTWRRLEEDIGKGLEEAGFGGDGNHIEIRVVTNQENIGDTIYLNDEEGERFRVMLMELVAGGAARKNEVRKQKNLHDNYNVVWRHGVAESLSVYEEEPEDVEAEIKSPKL